jgi:hypothetical protein
VTDEIFEALDALDTNELKDRALARARERGDVGFLWELIEHLPQASELATEDGASTGMATTARDLLAVIEQVWGYQIDNVGPMEPLLRARFIDYLMAPER